MASSRIFVVASTAVLLLHCTGDAPDTVVPGPGPSADGGGCGVSDRACFGKELRGCGPDGTSIVTLETCATEALCAAGLSSGTCAPPACGDGELKCEGADRFGCLPDRTSFATTKTDTCGGATPVCAAGACITCVTGTKSCNGSTPQECVANQWVAGTACNGEVSDTCAGGACVDIRIARWPMPNEPTSIVRPARYTVVSPNIVRDDVTGLEWHRGVSASPQAYQGGDVRQYCPAQTIDGVGGWHSPSLLELISLLDYSKAPQPLIDTAAFVDTPAAGLTASWTAGAWPRVNYGTGLIALESTTGSSYLVRCVRNPNPPPPGPRYTVGTDEVTDNWTKLTWRKTAPSGGHGAGVTICANLGGGYRMPTTKELYTLYDPTSTGMAHIDYAAFPVFGTNYAHWSSTFEGTTSNVAVDFAAPFAWAAITIQTTSGNIGYTRCVK